MADDGPVEKGAHYYKNKRKKEKKNLKNKEEDNKRFSLVDKDSLEYFRQVTGLLDADEFESEEEKETFLNNVFEQAKGQEMKLAQDQECSAILEKFLRASGHSQILAFFRQFSGSYSEMAKDRFASHVLQTILSLLPQILATQANAEDEEESDSAEKLFLNFGRECAIDWYRMSEDAYGSHVVRVVIGLACGGGLPSDLVRSKSSRSFRIRGDDTKAPVEEVEEEYEVPTSFKEILDCIVKTMLNRNYLVEEMNNPALSGVMQCVLLALRKVQPKDCRKMIMKLLKQPDIEATTLAPIDEINVRDRLITDPIGSRLMEIILKVSDEEMITQMYRECFRNKLAEYAKHPVANYIIQHLLSNTHSEVEAALMVEELIDVTESMLAYGHVGVVNKLVECCLLVPKLQKRMVNSIFKAFHVIEPADQKEIVPLILRLAAMEAYKGEDGTCAAGKEMPLKLQGALLLQSLFRLEQNTVNPVAISLLGLGLEPIMSLCMQPMGAYVVDGFLKGNTDLNLKRRLIKLFKGNYLKLAVDKNGSHTVDHCWNFADLKTKEWIAEELLSNETELNDSFYGRKVMYNCKLAHIKRKKEAWIEKQEANERKKAMFADILEDKKQVKSEKEQRLQAKQNAKIAKQVKKEKEKDGGELAELPRNEIDDMFSRKGCRMIKNGETPEEVSKESDEEEEEKKPKKKSKNIGKTVQTTEEKKQMDEDMEDVAAILKESTRKKSKKRKTEAADSDKTIKKKKKFTMN